jgi:hypothetical protein
MTDDDGTGTTGTIFNNAWKTQFYDQIDALLTADPTIFTSIVLTTAVGTWGNRLKYDGANQLFIGVPGTTTSKKVTFVDSTGASVASVDGVGNAAFSGMVLTSSPTGGIGYATGAGGTIGQSSSKATAVTLNKLSGQVTMNAAALGAGVKVSFQVSNSSVAAADLIVVAVISGGTANAYRAEVTAVALNSFTVTVENITAGSLSESPVIGFAVVKAVTS